jgi:NADH-quinone oxidoreductase subunit I
MGVFKDFVSLLKGMRITGKHLGRHAITVQYPEERDTIPERSRGIVVLLSDKETGELNCTACLLCQRVCPTAAITIVAPRNEKKKRELKSFEVNNGLCCFCGLCEEVCNFTALKMATKYEFSSIEKPDMIWDVKKLQEMGRDVPYTPKPKKKPKPAAKKPAAPKDGEKAADKPAAEAKPAEEKTPAANPEQAKPDVEAKPDDETKQPEAEKEPEAAAEPQAPEKKDETPDNTGEAS